MLRALGCDKHVIRAAQYFRCPSCDETKNASSRGSPNRSVSRTRCSSTRRCPSTCLKRVMQQVVVIACLAWWIWRRIIRLQLDYVLVETPSSKVCAEAMNLIWFTPFGSPEAVVRDQGVHNSGRVRGLLLAHGVEIRQVGAQAPHQLGTGERHGGLLKAIMKKAMHNRQLSGMDAISALCAEASRTKNVNINLGGFSPAQWVLGHTPTAWSSLVSHDGERHLGLHQNLVDLEEDKTPQSPS